MKAPDYAWLFAEDGMDFKGKMIEFIRKNFSDLLGDDAKLLDAPGGLDILRTLTQKRLAAR